MFKHLKILEKEIYKEEVFSRTSSFFSDAKAIFHHFRYLETEGGIVRVERTYGEIIFALIFYFPVGKTDDYEDRNKLMNELHKKRIILEISFFL